jgi:uncharacterized protein (DUF1684 family)
MSLHMVRTVLLLALVAATACTSGPPAPDEGAFESDVIAFRTAREAALREDPEAIPPQKRSLLLPLRYYSPDPKYSVPAALTLSDQRPIVEVPTSTGTVRRMQLVGRLDFRLDGQAMSLGALAPAGEPVRSLFVPFLDLTSGTETYNAGRYLDLHPTSTGVYTIDFNRAYNPTCAYNAAYECPYPPPSNRLKVAILAGEKKPPASDEAAERKGE